MRPRSRKFVGARWQGAFGFLALMTFCASIFPIPIPQYASKQDDGEFYFCKDRPCGCRSMEQCWTRCCCSSLEERLAWAKANGVTPPAYVATAVAAANQKTESTSPKHCCEKHRSDGDLHDDDAHRNVAPTSTKIKACCSPKNKTAQAKPKSQGASKTVIGMFVMQCQGKSSLFTSLAWFVATPHSDGIVLHDPIVESWCIASSFSNSPSLDLATPPPRRGA